MPIPWMGIIGYLIMFVCYIGMSASRTAMGSMIYCSVLWVGYALVSPSSVSMISVGKGEASEE